MDERSECRNCELVIVHVHGAWVHASSQQQRCHMWAIPKEQSVASN